MMLIAFRSRQIVTFSRALIDAFDLRLAIALASYCQKSFRAEFLFAAIEIDDSFLRSHYFSLLCRPADDFRRASRQPPADTLSDDYAS
jgi:hypothetical protein